MSNCPKCGAPLTEQSGYCPSCGSQLNQANQTPQPPYNPYQPQAPYDPFRQQQSIYQPPYQQPLYQQPPSITQKEKHITFIFVSSLIFLIFFIIRTITSLSSLGTWSELGTLANSNSVDLDAVINAAYFSIALTLITFAAALILFILSATCRNKQKPVNNRITLSKALLALSVIVLICGVIYAVSEIVLLNAAVDFYKQYNVPADDLTQLQSQMTGSLVFDFTFVAFGIINLIKSALFIGVLKQKQNQQQGIMQPPA